MKKILKQPWIYILLVNGLCISINALAPLALDRLEGVLPEKNFLALEESYAFRGYPGGPLQSLLLAGAFVTALVCSIQQIFRPGKTLKFALLYFLLGLFSLWTLLGVFATPRERAKRISCTSNLKQMHLVLGQYLQDYDGFFPPDLKTLETYNYLTDWGVYHCPSRRKANPDFSDYLYYGKDRKLSDLPFLLLEDRDRNHPGNFHNRMLSDGTLSGGK